MLSPPDYWKAYDGREKDEKMYLSSHVTMSVKVSSIQFQLQSRIGSWYAYYLGGFMD